MRELIQFFKNHHGHISTNSEKEVIFIFTGERHMQLEVHAEREDMHNRAENKDTHANYSHAFI